MARTRDIKPGFFSNEDLGELDPLARLLFSGMWCFADREGRLEDRPKKLKAEILPYDSCDGGALVNALTEKGFLLRYEVAGKKYIQITNWKKHQSPHPKESPSLIPPPPSPSNAITEESNGISVASNEQVTEKVNPRLTQDESFNPIPSYTSIPSCNTTTTAVNAREGEAENSNNNLDDITAEIFTLYQGEIGIMTGVIADKLKDLIDHYPRDWLIQAIGLASVNNVRKINYVEGILSDWVIKGYGSETKPWEVEKGERTRKSKSRAPCSGGKSKAGTKPSKTDWQAEREKSL